MKLLFLTRFFLAGSLLFGLALSELAGNPAYTVKDLTLYKEVFTKGYENGEKPVVKVEIDEFYYKITAKSAWNAYDETPNKLYLNQIIMALWTREGLNPNELKSIEFSWIVNEPTKIAIEAARTDLGLCGPEDFSINNESGVSATAWSALMACPFGKVTQRMADQAGKSVVKISVTDSGIDDMAFELV